MKYTKSLRTILAPGLLALLISGNAAADWSWNFTGSSSGGASGLTYSGSTSGGSGPAPSVTATGWSNSTYSSSTSGSSYGSGNLVQRGIYKYSGGLGVTSPDDVGEGSPEHATDNQYRIDSILLDFGGTAVTLSQVQFGWYSGDSDFSLAAYTGVGTPDLGTMEYSDLAGNGWTVIDSYYNAGTSAKDVNGGEISSSYWLISALNPDLGGSSSSSYYANDFFKLKIVEGVPGGPPPNTVPEPSTLILLGMVVIFSLMRGRIIEKRQTSCALQA